LPPGQIRPRPLIGAYTYKQSADTASHTCTHTYRYREYLKIEREGEKTKLRERGRIRVVRLLS